MNVRGIFCLGLGAAALTVAMAMAQTTGQSTSAANRMGTRNHFMTAAAQGGMSEVELGRLATERASDPKVKQFGQRMVDDHSKANDELKQLAKQKGVSLPATVDAKQKATHDRLAKLSGAQFDHAYMDDMVKDHKEDIAEFQKEANSNDDADVKGFASKTLPTLQHHLQLAEDTQAQINK